MRELILKDAVELKLPARQNMMLVIRLTTAGVIARAGLTVDRMDDVKLAVEEACSCLISAQSAPVNLFLRFSEDEQGLKIRICADCECGGVQMGEDERTVVQCILESLVSSAEVCMRGDAVGSIELRVALN